MKVCILSMQRVNNYGSLLQGYSLKRIIESLGHEVSFIDIEQNEKDNMLLQGKRKVFSGEREFGNKEKFISKIDRYFLNRMRGKWAMKKQDAIMDDFRDKILKISSENNKDHYDFCVIGSDEVFNCLSNSQWGFTSQLFGNVRQADNVITYAASCGATVCDELSVEVKDKIKESLNSLVAISVRDYNTELFVSNICKRDSYMHLDPVMVGGFKDELESSESDCKLPERFCIVYAYYNRIYKDEEIQKIQNLCKKENMTLVSVGAPQKWIRRHLILTPFQTLKAFQKAEFVITDTFHGSIFAAKYSKRFATIVRSSNKNKLNDLVDKLKIREHVVSEEKTLSEVYSIIHDKEEIRKLESEQREKTLNYFLKYLGKGDFNAENTTK